MNYVPRRVQLTAKDGTKSTVSDQEFASLDAPLVLLGEPGAGKTCTARAIGEFRSGMPVSAYEVASGAPVEIDPSDIPVIDGLDEVQVSSSEQPLLAVLRRLKQIGCSSFVITCRAADWANVQSERAISSWFGCAPVIGHLEPLNDVEIVAVVDALGTFADGGESFFTQAEQRSAVDLARNPQSLKLLLAAIGEDGWPSTKTELYELACRNLATEPNEIHKSLAPARPNLDCVLLAAGFVNAQLLLAGNRGVNVDGQDKNLFPRPAELAGKGTSEDQIEAVVSSLLFRPIGAAEVEPMHRTVAEFLAAMWLSHGLRNGSLSARRLEALLYTQGAVPGPLRGLHAWLATLDRDMTDQLVAHDPYGCFRYGDVTQFTADQARNLILQLQNLANVDPHFRSEDWDAQIGGGLARLELRAEIVQLINNPDVPYQLSTVVLESLRGSEFAETIRDDLRQVALNDEMTFVTRDRALAALGVGGDQEDWNALVTELGHSDSHSSARMAIEVVLDQTCDFSGDEIAQTILNYDSANEEQAVGLSLGIEYRLFQKMNIQQLGQAITVLVARRPTNRHTRSKLERKTEERVIKSVQTFLEKGGEPTADQFISWLEYTTSHNHRARDWNTFSIEYFRDRPKLRRDIQSLFLAIPDDQDRWTFNYGLREMASGLILQDADVAFHLEALVACEREHNDFAARWREFVEWIFANRDFAREASLIVRQQARTRPALEYILKEIENRPAPSWQTEQEERDQKNRKNEQQKSRARHRMYSDINLEVRAGQQLGALNDIATSYLGLFTEVTDMDNTVGRVAWLVGQRNLDAAIEGLLAACKRADLPTPRMMAELHVTESKRYFLERIVLAGCAVHVARGGKLADLPKQALLCALAGCQWGLYSQERMGADGLEEALQKILFSNVNDVESFIRDALEPALFAGGQHVSGLYEFTHDEQFAPRRGDLCLEWLARSEGMSTQSLKYLLAAAVDECDPSTLSDLIAEKLAANTWHDDEHRKNWFGAAFTADFSRFEPQISAFSAEGLETLFSLTTMMFTERSGTEREIKVSQLTFLIDNYAADYPITQPSHIGLGDNELYSGGRFIASCISKLGDKLTEKSQLELERIVCEDRVGNHADHLLHVVAEHTRAMAEAAWSIHSLHDVRSVLLAGEPQTSEDLQQLVMDELDTLKRRVRDGSFKSILPFWNGTTPHKENYCRDRIAEHLEPHLARYGVRLHPEAAMPNNKRCDLLCTIGEMNLPIEIKGQWHREVWSAASNQLEENYSREYRADGRGVYLVLWFGNVPGENPPGIRKHGPFKNAEHMLDLLPERSPAPINEKTSLFVFDLDKP